MAHQRVLIRNAIKQRLLNANTSCGTRIFTNRSQKLFETELPCILIYTSNEPAEISIEAPREYLRNLQVNLEIVAQADDSLDDVLDNICQQVETAIFQDETFGDLVVDTVLSDTGMDILSDGDKPVGGAKITLTMPYRSSLPAAPYTELDPFVTADVKMDVEPIDGQIESEDTITLPQ